MPNSPITRQIKGEIFNSLRNALVAPQGKSKKSWTDLFIQEMLDEAKKNPSGPLGQLLSKQLLQDDIISSLDAQTEKLLARDQDFLQFRIYKQCYKEQRDVLLDETSKWIMVNTGRRTGKTNLAARWLVKKCAVPNSPCFYIHLKFDSAISQLFDLCIESATKAELAIESSSKNEGRIIFSNGSSITFRGNSNKAEADKLRGYKARGIVIDEAAFQINERYLVEDIFTPMMADYSDAQMLLISTPPRIPHTYYENCYRSGKWTLYEWNAKKNPFIPSFEDFIKEVCEKKDISLDDTFVRRELMGEFVYDTEARVIKNPMFYTGGNDFVLNEIRNGRFKADYIYAGVDFGFSDFNAIVPIAWDKSRKVGYILNNYKFNRATVTEIVEKMKYSLAECQEVLIASNTDPHNIMYYGDNSDKSIIFELMNNYQFPIQTAYKHDKMEALSVLAELFRRKIYTDENCALADEFEMCVYKRDEETDAILPELDDDVFHGDSLMAALYGSRALVQFENPIGSEDSVNIDDKKLPDPEFDDSYIKPDENNPSEFDSFA